MSTAHNIIHITDCHINARTHHHGGNTRDMLLAVLEVIRQDESPDMLVVTGDLADDGSHEAYLWLRQQFSTFSCPVLVLPGNHDDVAGMASIFNTQHELPGKPRQLGNWLIVPLNSCYAGHESGLLSAESLAELDRILAAHPAAHVMITLHHYPLTIGSEWLDRMGLENAVEFLDIVARHHQVRLILSGHIHQVSELAYHGIPVLSTPATCRQFQPGSRHFAIDPIPAGYRRLSLNDNGKFETIVIRLDEPTWANCLHKD